MSGGFAESPLRMNEGLGAVERWDANAIRERAAKLATRAVEIWSGPKLPKEILADYRPKPEGGSAYSLDDHAHLKNPEITTLFDALRKEILSLDPCVFEEVFKLYIAYKAETNFVDIVPQATKLRLSLNMRFPDIVDPKDMCLDVTNRGRWGNGDVEVGLSHLDELPYIMGLVRQSLEKQMGNGDSGAIGRCLNSRSCSMNFPTSSPTRRRRNALLSPIPRAACFYARLALEVAVKWMYRHDRSLRSPYENTLAALIHEPSFRDLVGHPLVAKAKIVKDLGNTAVHETRDVPADKALTCASGAFPYRLLARPHLWPKCQAIGQHRVCRRQAAEGHDDRGGDAQKTAGAA